MLVVFKNPEMLITCVIHMVLSTLIFICQNNLLLGIRINRVTVNELYGANVLEKKSIIDPLKYLIKG